MPFRITCPHCDAVLELDDSQAGQVVQCYSCRGVLQVPEPEPVIPVAMPPGERDAAGGSPAWPSVLAGVSFLCSFAAFVSPRLLAWLFIIPAFAAAAVGLQLDKKRKHARACVAALIAATFLSLLALGQLDRFAAMFERLR